MEDAGALPIEIDAAKMDGRRQALRLTAPPASAAPRTAPILAESELKTEVSSTKSPPAAASR